MHHKIELYFSIMVYNGYGVDAYGIWIELAYDVALWHFSGTTTWWVCHAEHSNVVYVLQSLPKEIVFTF